MKTSTTARANPKNPTLTPAMSGSSPPIDKFWWGRCCLHCNWCQCHDCKWWLRLQCNCNCWWFRLYAVTVFEEIEIETVFTSKRQQIHEVLARAKPLSQNGYG